MISFALNNSLISIVFAMGIVISKIEITESIPVGSTRQYAEEYLLSIAGEFQYFARDEDRVLNPAYPWSDSEVGYLHVLVRDVRERWWLPDMSFLFGELIYRVRVGITGDGLVSHVEINDFVFR